MDETLLLVAAHRAYERGRIRHGLRRAALAAPLAALPLYHCLAGGRTLQTGIGITCVVALVAVFSWRGEGFERGIRPGLVAGAAPLLLPLISLWLGLPCLEKLCGVLPFAAVTGGLLGGLALAGGALGTSSRNAGFWFAAAATTTALGVVGCLHAGLAGLAGMAVGLLTGSLLPLAALKLGLAER
jgi:hypothetical protein